MTLLQPARDHHHHHDDKDPTTLPKEGLEGTGESDWCEFVAGCHSTRRTTLDTTIIGDPATYLVGRPPALYDYIPCWPLPTPQLWENSTKQIKGGRPVRWDGETIISRIPEWVYAVGVS